MLVCYDIDGTITKDNVDIWYESVSCSIRKLKEFESKVKEWKTSENKLEDSYNLMNYSIRNVIKKELVQNADEYTDFILKNNLYRKAAVKSILENSKKYKIKFITTNIQEVAELFIYKLLEKYNIPIHNIEVLGTKIDWNRKSIIHFNMGKNKIININDKIFEAYGDDPFFNDKEMLERADNAFLIVNEKNKKCNKFKKKVWV